MGGALSFCCPCIRTSEGPQEEGVHVPGPGRPVSTIARSTSPTTSLTATSPDMEEMDSQNTFEFGDALHIPQDGGNGELRPKRNSITAWLVSGIFARPGSKSPQGSFKERVLQPVKMLMCGTGESGKSTIIKQMKIIHQGGFTPDELVDFREQIFRNIHVSMIHLFEAMDPTILSRDEQTLQAVWIVKRFKTIFADIEFLPPDYVAAINYLWVELIRGSFESINRKGLVQDSSAYFFDEIDRIAAPGFVPRNDDVLRARLKTTGINEYTFKSGPLHIRMLDVGGQRPERRKWIETFDNVTTLIFCVAISEYDQMLKEEPRQNRLLESFQLWESVINSKWFLRTSIVLFLNKKDIFRKKLASSPLKKFFPEYHPLDSAAGEEAEYEHAAEFLKNKFLSMNYSRVQIYPFLTCATDTRNIDMVFAAVKESVMANNLRTAGIL